MARNNTLRIIGGQLKSRLIYFKDSDGLRPTPDRIRETVFNWLQDKIVGSKCLDLFAGSGAIGFEAISRGAEHVVFTDSNKKVVNQIKDNTEKLEVADKTNILFIDYERFLKKNKEIFDIVFLDPPFNQNILRRALKLFERKPFAKYIYIEYEKDLELEIPEIFSILKEKTSGDVCYKLLLFSDEDGTL